MLQMNPQMPMNTTHVSIPNLKSQNIVGNKGLTTFRGAEDNLALQSPLTQDSFEPGSKLNVECKSVPQISTSAAIFHRLSFDEVDQINESGKLPENMMVSHSPSGGYRLNWKNPITNGCFVGGTQDLPEHLEVKNNVFGFTSVVPKGYESWLFPKYED